MMELIQYATSGFWMTIATMMILGILGGTAIGVSFGIGIWRPTIFRVSINKTNKKAKRSKKQTGEK